MNAWNKNHGGQGAALVPPGAIHRVATTSAGSTVAQPSSAAPAVAAAAAQPAKRVSGVVPVRVLDAFFQLLPHPSVQQVSRSYSARYVPSSFVNAGDAGTIALYTPPDGSVFVVTDIKMFATAPSQDWQGPPVALSERCLLGMFDFRINVGGMAPIAIETGRPRGYRTTASGSESLQSGWGSLESAIGSSRAFALYVRGQRQLEVVVHLAETGQAPRFVLSVIGAECHGFTVSETIFDRLWLRLTSEGSM